MEQVNSILCERVRAFVSLELDDDVSELERSVLEAHTEHCRACREFRVEVSGFTAALRVAPPEALSRSFRLPRRRRLAPSFTTTAAAAAAAMVIAGLAGVLAPVTGDGDGSFEIENNPSLTQPLGEIANGPFPELGPVTFKVPRPAPPCKSFSACPR